METKASYIVTGAFTLAVIAGVFGFLYWVQNGAGDDRERESAGDDVGGLGFHRSFSCVQSRARPQ